MNIINAIINLTQNTNTTTNIQSNYLGNNRANNMGDALEEYIKDLFANTFNLSEQERIEKQNETFSYLGNTANPPDAMLLNGDAIEIKKIERENAQLALNSSYPKHKIYSSSPMITQACINAENWTEKDIIYVIGVVKNNTLKHLCMVYGLDYCASEECYMRIKDTIKNGIKTIQNVDFAETKELGRINKVDPLGITYMRIRGMWGIENPWKVFRYIYTRNHLNKFDFMCIININKWNTFDNKKDLIDLAKINNNLTISDVKIKDPNNPAKIMDAKCISFEY